MSKLVYIIDDSATARLFSKRNVRESIGACVIKEAIDGKAALESIENVNDVDLFIVDNNMPNMNGNQFISVIRRMQKVHIPIIMITAFSEESKKQEALEAGADIYITKPYSLEVFQRALRQLMVREY